MRESKIKAVLDLLKRQYGRRYLELNPDPVGEMVQTILSQNTSDINSRPAFNALENKFKKWEDILIADVDGIATVISAGGLGKIKARRIQQSLQQVLQQRGNLDLRFLDSLPLTEARDWLKMLPGVGDKTANCVLLFAFGKPALPVDTHIFRVAKRLGLLREQTNLEEAHLVLEQKVPPADIYEFHVLMIEHGRSTCLAQRPRCTLCALSEICPSYLIFADHPSPRRGS